MKAYMHTINGKPAQFTGGQICFAPWKITRFAKDLRQIRREQDATKQYRKDRNYSLKFNYGYRIIYLPAPQENNNG